MPPILSRQRFKGLVSGHKGQALAEVSQEIRVSTKHPVEAQSEPHVELVVARHTSRTKMPHVCYDN